MTPRPGIRNIAGILSSEREKRIWTSNTATEAKEACQCSSIDMDQACRRGSFLLMLFPRKTIHN